MADAMSVKSLCRSQEGGLLFVAIGVMLLLDAMCSASEPEDRDCYQTT